MELKWWDKVHIQRLRSKNKKICSSYLYICDRNKNKERMLITFTSSKKTAFEKLSHIKEIKNHFSKLLSNLKIDIDKFSVIEIGANYSNPHLHLQLFYNEVDFNRIVRAFNKTLIKFNLNEKRSILTKEDKSKHKLNYFVYILKEYSKNLSDSEILKLDKSRSSLKSNENKNVQLVSHSHGILSKKVYKELYYQYKIDYLVADTLYKFNFFNVKNQANNKASKIIQWSLSKILKLIVFCLVFSSVTIKIRQKFLYNNKCIKYIDKDSFSKLFYLKSGFT